MCGGTPKVRAEMGTRRTDSSRQVVLYGRGPPLVVPGSPEGFPPPARALLLGPVS